MKRAHRLHLGLLVSVALLAALVGWSARHETAMAAPDTLLPLPADAVTTICIDTRQGVTRAFVKRDGQWHMTTPHQGLANQKHLQRLAALADAKVLGWRPVADFQPAKIGMAPPWATITVDGHALAFGALSALAPQRYVRVGDHIAMIRARYAADIRATPESELASAGRTLPSL